MRKQTSILLLLLVFLVVGTPVAAQEENASGKDRPTIGLALGGGAARGAAHVGVIRELERLGIPIDYIAGTSMGAIVGALYSLGLTADEIEVELTTVDWADIFSDRSQRQHRSMRRKEDDTATFFPIEFGFRGGRLVSPRGFIAGQKFAFAFKEPGLLISGHDSFDNLPIPFRAVATDLETGDKVVLDHGNLMRAVRASMSIPSVSPPVEYEGTLLVDGYLASNVAVDVVREMGADIVIAIDVGRRPEDMTREQLMTLGGISEQTSRIMSELSVRDEVSRADIVIKPQVNEWVGTEFDRMESIIPLGNIAAIEVENELARLAVDPDQFERWRNRIEDHPLPHPEVDLIVLDNLTRIDDQVIHRLIHVPTDAPLDLGLLKTNLGEIYELGLVESVDFDLQLVAGYNILTIIVREKPYAPYIIHFGGAYSLGYDGASNILLHARINKREINRLGGEWRTDLAMGQITGIETEFYQPLDYGRAWFVRAGLLADFTIASYYDRKYTVGQYRYTRMGGGLGAGVNLWRTGQVNGGFEVTRAHTEAESGTVPQPNVSETRAGPLAVFKLDRLDDHRIPRNGVLLDARWRGPRQWFGTDLSYDRFWGHMTLAKTAGRSTLLGQFQGGTDFGSGMPYYEDFFLGGMRSLSGYKRNHLRGRASAVASLGVLQRLGGGSLPFASRYYLGFWFDVGNTWAESSDATFADLKYNGAVSLVLDTPLGPFELGFGLAEQGQYAFHFDFGIHFASPAN